MPNENRDKMGSYAPGWLKKSRDDVPPSDEPLRDNSVFNEIVAGQNPTNQQDAPTQQAKPERTQSESDR